MTDVTMVVVVLIATMAFQAAVSPPGGVWQEDTPTHRTGKAVMASTHPKMYGHLVRANTTAFIASLITIFLVTTGLLSTNILFMAVAMYSMFVSLTAISISYGASLAVITPTTRRQAVGHLIMTVLAVVLNLFALITAYVVVRKLYLTWKRKKRQQQDLTADAFVRRVFYWIFQQLETRGFLSCDR